MSKTYFSKDHEWVRTDGQTGTVGITDFAQKQLGDVVYVDLPDVGRILTQGAEAAVVESVKAASEVYAPVSGEVIEINNALTDNPAEINASAEDKAWFFKIRLSNPAELDSLMDRQAYDDYIKDLH